MGLNIRFFEKILINNGFYTLKYAVHRIIILKKAIKIILLYAIKIIIIIH